MLKGGLIAAVALVAILGGALAVDHAISGSRIYRGVTIGRIDVSGMTVEEATRAIEASYAPTVAEGYGIIFANEEVASSIDVQTALTEEAAQAEQSSVEEARAEKKLWIAEAGALGARVPAADLAKQAYEIGRETGLKTRLQAAAEGITIPVHLMFDDDAVEALASEIDQTIGTPRQEYDLVVDDGAVSVVEGHDGTVVDRVQFVENIEKGFLDPSGEEFSFVAQASYAPLDVTAEEAERARSFVQAVLDRGISFSFEGQTWTLDGEALGQWIATEVQQTDNGYRLLPLLDGKAARDALLALIRDAGFSSAVTVNFEVEGDIVWVNAQEGSRFPAVDDAVSAATAALFDAYRQTGSLDLAGEKPTVSIEWGAAPARSTFDEALESGLITAISSYTTEYNDAPSTANRRHNIHLAADLLDNSIAPALGGIWSFSGTMGQANEEAGFKGAHAISSGEYVDAIGGGICQVATTVFNAVFEAGYPVVQRRNHSLYISSYPTGRDAAIAYPDLDLKWENDGSSDVLLRTRYTDSSITVTLYGIDPGYVVSSQTGDWAKGDPYKTRTKVDESESPGTRYVKTKGADGRSVTVHRTVRDRAGNVIHEEDFTSYYAPIDEVVVVGPDTPAQREDDKEDDGVLSTGD